MVTLPQSSKRDAGIDIARGIAIIIMMGANMGLSCMNRIHCSCVCAVRWPRPFLYCWRV